MKQIMFFLVIISSALSCIKVENEGKLPILGPRETEIVSKNGIESVDTIYHQIPDFSFINQDSVIISQSTFNDKFYVVDFFFTSCPTICPVMSGNMLKLYNAFEQESRIAFLSHSIDTRYDSVPVLKDYATKLGVEGDRWHFVTGSREDIYGIAKDYLIAVGEDKNAPGGYIHSGAFILIDSEKRIRGYYDGTKEEDIVKLTRQLKAVFNAD